jgi:protein SCO1/2
MKPAGIMLAACLGAMALVGAFLPGDARAQYFRRPVSELDPNVMLIDEKTHLGSKIDPSTVLVDQDGREFRWGDKLGTPGKPVILLMSYYTCDGSCSIINSTFAGLLAGVNGVKPGKDYEIVTLSFDRHDTLETTGAFRKHLALAGPIAAHWTFATFKNEADLKSETDKIGFKFFWSPEDRVFLHPGAFLFFGSDGRLMRVLYQDDVDARDVELAVLDAKQGQFRPGEIITFALSLCYSYSYHDGKYVMSIPIFVGLGSLGVGLMTLFGSILFFKSAKRMKRTGEHDYAQAV